MLLGLFGLVPRGNYEFDEFHGQVQDGHADEYTGDSVDKYAYRCFHGIAPKPLSPSGDQQGAYHPVMG